MALNAQTLPKTAYIRRSLVEVCNNPIPLNAAFSCFFCSFENGLAISEMQNNYLLRITIQRQGKIWL